ncbi:MAG: hypothetical protein NT069_12995, partial [Planctomycetota bacterium]|nr:hypothetical protein [Planctomycetota bacterium]
ATRFSSQTLTFLTVALAMLLAVNARGFAEETFQEGTPPAAAPADAAAPAAPAPPVLIAPPSAETVRGKITAWLAQRGTTDAGLVEKIAQRWTLGDEPRTPEELFELAIATLSDVDADTKAFVDACGLTAPPLLPPEPKLLERVAEGPFYTANLGLVYAKYLVHRQMFDEALALLESLPATEVVDPAALLFSKAVCQHHLLQKAPGLATIEQLLKNTTGVPMRYATLASLMQYDLESLQDKSLDEVAKRMFDVERRLKLARTGEKVQKREEEVITTLDEIIKKIEEQQGGGGGSGGNSNKSSAPAQDSVIKGSTAPGNVDPKKFKNTGEWGDLPPKERSKAKEDIARKFGAHYAEAVEKFNVKQAGRPARKDK